MSSRTLRITAFAVSSQFQSALVHSTLPLCPPQRHVAHSKSFHNAKAFTASAKVTPDTQIPSLTRLMPTLAVHDLPATISYYVKKLGFEVEAEYPTDSEPIWASLKQEHVTVMFSTMKSMAEVYSWNPTEKIGRGLMLYFEVEDTDQMYERVRNAEIEVVQEPVDRFYGKREFTVKDLNGYILTFGGPRPKNLSNPT